MHRRQDFHSTPFIASQCCQPAVKGGRCDAAYIKRGNIQPHAVKGGLCDAWVSILHAFHHHSQLVPQLDILSRLHRQARTTRGSGVSNPSQSSTSPQLGSENPPSPKRVRDSRLGSTRGKQGPGGCLIRSAFQAVRGDESPDKARCTYHHGILESHTIGRPPPPPRFSSNPPKDEGGWFARKKIELPCCISGMHGHDDRMCCGPRDVSQTEGGGNTAGG